MPWTGASFKAKHNHRLSEKQAGKAAAIANSVLERTGNDALAIRVANSRVKGKAMKKPAKSKKKSKKKKAKPVSRPVVGDYTAGRRSFGGRTY